MSAFGDVLRHIMLYDKARIYGRVYVVSAYSGVTNQLLEHKKTGEPGIYALFAGRKDYHGALNALGDSLKKLNAGFAGLGLPLEVADAFVDTRIGEARNYLDAMHHVLSSGYLSRENVLLAAREVLASIGESHSAFNAVEMLKASGVKAILLDLAGFHDNETWTIDERIHNSFKGLDLANNVVVATGYTKGIEGIMREFDRGYSEVTFSKIAVEVRPAEAVIHKEFHLSSADPNIVGLENAVIVGATNYDVADQLADVGMEAIHPKAAKPMERAGIPIRLKNTFDPEHPGTLITKDYVGERARVEIVTGSERSPGRDPRPEHGRLGGLRPRHHGDLPPSRCVVHPQGYQRQLDRPSAVGQLGHRRADRRARGELPGGDHQAQRGGVHHRLETSASLAFSRAPRRHWPMPR